MSGVREKPFKPSAQKALPVATALLPSPGSHATPLSPEGRRAPVPTALLPPEGAPLVSATAVLPPDGAPRVSAAAVPRPTPSSLVQPAVKASPPESPHGQIPEERPRATAQKRPPDARWGRAVHGPGAFQVVSLPVVLISAAVLLAVAATVLMVRHDSRRSAQKQAVPAAQLHEGPPEARQSRPEQARLSAPGAESPASEAGTAAAIELSEEPRDEPPPVAEGTSDEVGAEESTQGRQMGPAEGQGRVGGHTRRRW
jgi:hypothetical protein